MKSTDSRHSSNYILFCFVLWAVSNGLITRVLHAADRAPNVVFILADDLGYAELGCFGQQKIRTPNLDSLARDGMRLTQHYSGNAVCAPSRCVLMTGKHPGHAFIRDNRSTPPEGQWPIPDSELTMLEIFSGLGYQTGAFGKWGLGGPDSTGDPMNQGVGRFFGYNCQAHAHSYYPSYLWSDKERVALKNSPEIPGHGGLAPGADPTDPRSYNSYKGTDYAPDRINEQALEFVRVNKDRPFFLYYPSVIPHVALHVPDDELKPYLELGWNDPPFVRQTGGYTPHFTPRAAYAAMISKLDSNVGKLLRLLEDLGLSENTIVVFSSDNGATHLNEEVDVEFFQSVGTLRGLKGSLYEGGVRVPGIVRWPGHTPASSQSDRVSGFEDWMPTLLTMTGNRESIPEKIDGVDMSRVLLGQSQPEREFLYREFPGYGGQQSLRMGRWKAVRQNMSQGNLEVELYDMQADASESKNVAAQNPEIVEQLTLKMAEQHQPSVDFPLIPIDAPVRQRR
ncbi:MAG: arylsulfatase [Planctomycetales bacterium]|nr:arylsulfatase [Planctomycetales bacterium]